MKIKNNFKIKSTIEQFCLLLIMLFLTVSVSAQAQVVKGKVISTEDGLPIPGVTVLVKGQAKSTATDFDGNFSINAKNGDMLSFSFIGMLTSNVKVTGPVVNVKLKASAENLDEIVVIGYGTVKKKELTGAVASLKASDIENQVTSDLGNALQGQISGVSVVSSKEPGGSSEIQIRGVTSIVGGNGPLFVVDGIAQEGDPGIAPNEIESIDVLKDAASTAVYGVRAAAGVILITTKKGKAGTMKVNISATKGFNRIGNGIALLNSRDQSYVNLVEARNNNPALKENAIPLQTLQSADSFQNDTDITKLLFIDDSSTSNYTLNLNGGSKELVYSFNGGFYDDKGIITGNTFNRFNLRSNAGYKKDRVSFNIGLGIVKEVSLRGGSNLVPQLYRYQPTVAFNDPNASDLIEVGGQVGDATLNTSLIDGLTQKNETKNDRYFGNINFGYEITKNLNFATNIGFNEYESKTNSFYPRKVTIDISKAVGLQEQIFPGSLALTDVVRSSLNWDAGLTYKTKILKNHNLTFTGVISSEVYNGTSVLSKRTDVSNDSPVFLGATGLASVTSGPDYTHDLRGYMGRFQYDYKGKYLLTSSVRRDGSSRFAPQNRWGIFPSVSGAWNISDEKFFEPLKKNISSLKFRVSQGTVGNENFGDYLYSTPLVNQLDYSFSGSTLASGTIQNRFANPDVRWEVSTQTNIGFDLAMFKNKLTISAEYYNTSKEDMLFNVTLPGSAGTNDSSYQSAAASPNILGATRPYGNLNGVVFNVGNMTNSGYELAIGYKDRVGKVNYRMNATFSTNQNKITKVLLDNPKPILTSDNGVVSGQPLSNDDVTHFAIGREAGAFFLYETDGIIRNQAELDAYKLLVPDTNAIIGDARMVNQLTIDTDGDGIMDKADSKIDVNDKVYKGSGLPQYEIGYNLNLNYKNFDFSMNWFAAVGQEIINGAKATSFTYKRNNELLDAYSATNINGAYPALNIHFAENYAANTDRFLEDGSYIRLRNVTLGYNLSKKLVSHIGATGVRFFFTAQNILTLTKYTGYDPEIGGSVISRGLDKNAYPLAKSYLFGINFNF